MGQDQLKRLKELEKENQRLRRAVSDLTLDKLILTEARGAPMRLRSPWMSSGRSRDISRCLQQGEFNWNDRSIYRLSTYRALLAA